MIKNILNPRWQLGFFGLCACALLAGILIFSPVQAPVVVYKLALVTVAAILAVFFDFAAFPFAAPSSYLDHDWRTHPDADNPCNADYPVAKGYQRVFAAAMLRRGLIIAAFVVAVALGL